MFQKFISVVSILLVLGWFVRRFVSPQGARRAIQDSFEMVAAIAGGLVDGVCYILPSPKVVRLATVEFFVGRQDGELKATPLPEDGVHGPAGGVGIRNKFVSEQRNVLKIRCAGTGYAGPCRKSRNYTTGEELYLCKQHEAQRAWLEG